MNVLLGFAKSDVGNPDESGFGMNEQYGLAIDSGMGDYEWSTLTVEIPAEYAGTFLGKFVLQFGGSEIAIRAVSVENV